MSSINNMKTALFLLLNFVCFQKARSAHVGVNFGNFFSQIPISEVDSFNIIKSKGIKKIKLFGHKSSIMSAINQTISTAAEVVLAVPNGEVEGIASDLNQALNLLQPFQNFKPILKYIAVSNEPDTFWASDKLPTILNTAIENINKAQATLGLAAKIIVPFTMGIISDSYPPSRGVFNPSWNATITPLLKTLQSTNSAFVVNIYPYFSWRGNTNQISLDYALGSPQSSTTVTDGANMYRNLFDAMYDSAVAALEKAGYGSLPLVVGETGWPTAGGNGASISNACTYNNNLIRRVSNSSLGTPRRKNQKIPVYLFEIFDELKKTGDGVEPYWGLGYENGTFKYNVDWEGLDANPCSRSISSSPPATTAAPTNAPTKQPTKAPTSAPTISNTTNTTINNTVVSVGVNYAYGLAQSPLPKLQALTLLKNKGITKIKLFDHDLTTVQAINATYGRNAQIIIGFSNQEMQALATNYSLALSLLRPFKVYNSLIRYVAVASEPEAEYSVAEVNRSLNPAVNNVVKALKNLTMSAKVTVPFTMNLLAASYPPSAGNFKSDWNSTIVPLLKTLNSTGSAFMMNIHPYGTWVAQQSNINLDYALGRPINAPTVADGTNSYRSLLFAMYDAVVAALEKAGYPKLRLIIGETGWPSSGGAGATTSNACLYINNMIKSTSSVKGTPGRPGARIESYIFEAYDEGKKATGTIEPNWGVFFENGTSKYSVDWKGNTNISCSTATTSVPTSSSSTTSNTTADLPPLPPRSIDNRNFVFYNKGNRTLYVAMIGHRTSNGANLNTFAPELTGFALGAGEKQIKTVPSDLSGRVWARTGCKLMSKSGCVKPDLGTSPINLVDCPSGCGNCLLVCDTGSCGADNGLASLIRCGTLAGEPPASLAEFTLSPTDISWYDASLVDGENLNEISMAPIAGRFDKLGLSANSAKYDCGAPTCQIPQNNVQTWCPPELQVRGYTGQLYCTSICKAVTLNWKWSQVDDTVAYDTEVGQKTPRAYLQYMATAEDWRHPNHISAGKRGMMKDLLCSICGEGATAGCEQRNADGSFMENPTSPCTYGCSPYSPNYPASWWNRRAVAEALDGSNGEQKPISQLSDFPDWPLSTQKTHYAKLYSNFCPDSYTWQFQDMSSTFMCKKADFLFTLGA